MKWMVIRCWWAAVSGPRCETGWFSLIGSEELAQKSRTGIERVFIPPVAGRRHPGSSEGKNNVKR